MTPFGNFNEIFVISRCLHTSTTFTICLLLVHWKPNYQQKNLGVRRFLLNVQHKGSFFRWISILMLLLCDQSHTDQIWHGNSRGEGMFVRGQACPCPKWWGPIVPNIILDPLLMHTPFDVEHPKFGVVPRMERTCYRGKPCPRSHGVGPFAVQF